MVDIDNRSVNNTNVKYTMCICLKRKRGSDENPFKMTTCFYNTHGRVLSTIVRGEGEITYLITSFDMNEI